MIVETTTPYEREVYEAIADEAWRSQRLYISYLRRELAELTQSAYDIQSLMCNVEMSDEDRQYWDMLLSRLCPQISCLYNKIDRLQYLAD